MIQGKSDARASDARAINECKKQRKMRRKKASRARNFTFAIRDGDPNHRTNAVKGEGGEEGHAEEGTDGGSNRRASGGRCTNRERGR